MSCSSDMVLIQTRRWRVGPLRRLRRRQKLRRPLRLAWMKLLWPMLLPGGQFIDVGTLWHAKDAHATEILGVPGDRIPRREDFFCRVRSAELPDGGVYFPEQFDTSGWRV